MGEFHQLILGNVDGWLDLGVGDNSKVDLVKEDNSIYIELKNKYNTCNSDTLTQVKDKLIKVLEENEQAKAYWGFIVPSTAARSGSIKWKKRAAKTQPGGTSMAVIHDRLYKAWGSEVYKIVTGDGDNLKRLYDALPNEISGIMNNRINFIDIANEIAEEFTDHLDQIREDIFEYSFVKKK
ncbi:Eco47II family restriction endonuclease [Pseudoalteromonas sp. 2CM28B]|uniref:Eco47II family restriction endonuclease n=1 Tax=Pseudoalteromonas sp. 2CM28B TaxID=2929851 RepID=UPI0027E07543|nr:Eco47II family restriction endonuclease [Pseudoalteromonas sp. 2CM28B]